MMKVEDKGMWIEVWDKWFECPSCKVGEVRFDELFCSTCGEKLDWKDVKDPNLE